MRFEHDKMVVWFATGDAPAPTGEVPAKASGDAVVTVAAAVQPPSAGNVVTVVYQVNGGKLISVPATSGSHEHVQKIEYFSARLPHPKSPPFRVGDRVEYGVIVRTPGGQVPSPADAAKLPLSFHIVAAGEKKTDAKDLSKAKADSGHPKSDAPPTAKSSHDDRSPSSADSKPEATATQSKSGSPTSAPAASPWLNKAQLLSLARLADSTIAEVDKADSALGKLLAEKIASQRKATVARATKGSSAALTNALQKVNFSPILPSGVTIAEAIDAGLAVQKLDKVVLQEAAKKLAMMKRSGELADSVPADTPVGRYPLFEPALREAELYKLTDSVKLADAKAERLVAMAGSPTLVDDDMLAALVTDKTLTPAEADSLGLVLSICFLADGCADLAIEIKSRLQTLPDILKIKAEEWLDAIKRSKAQSPDGLEASEYAAALRRAATNLYPMDALHALTVPADPRPLERDLTTVGPLAAKNEKVFGVEFDALDSAEVPAEHLPEVKHAYLQLQSLANQHPGLGIVDLLNGRDTPTEKVSTILKRLDLSRKMRSLNPDRDFMGLDYAEGSSDRKALNTDGLSDSDLHMAVAAMKASQRVHAMTGDVDHTAKIMASGYTSASEIAIDDPDSFHRKSGLPHKTARHYHKKAKSSLSKASHAVVSARDAYDGPFHRMPVGNVRSSIKDHLKAIPGFSDLFGNQDYCNCTECQSILGAPAYFVDLMTYVEENLTGRVFRGRKADDPLNLKVRRPDLWSLPLTCDNTNTLVSYLDIINPTLENYIAARHGHKGGPSDRNAIETIVYQHLLSKSHSSFQQPFILPLEKLDIYLEHFSVSRGRIARVLGADSNVVTKATLKISETVYRQITDLNPDHGFLKEVYGIPFAFTGNAAHVSALNIQDLLSATGYSRSDMERAATSRFATKGGHYKVRIHSEKKNAESVQNDVEKIDGLTADALHRLYRFTRLLRTLPWSISELDMVLDQLSAAESGTGLDEKVLSEIVHILDLRSRWTLPVDQLCALWSPIPTGSGSLFERLFNFAPLAQTDGKLPRPDFKFVHSSFSSKATALLLSASSRSPDASHAHHNTTQRLLAGLQVGDTDLALLITSLAPAIGADLANASDFDRGFSLNLPNLTLLYRHALLAHLLNLSIPALFQLIQLTGVSDPYVKNLTDLTMLLAFFDWYQASGYQLDDLGTITQATVLNPASYPDPQALAAKLATAVADNHSLEFADRVFMLLPGVTEAESQQMIAGNPTLFEAVPDAPTPAFQLTPAFTPNTVLQFADTVFACLPGVTATQSQQIVAANPGLFSTVSNTTSPTLQLAATFAPTTAIVIPDGISLSSGDANAAILKYVSDAAAASSAALAYHPVQVIPSALAGLMGVDHGTLSVLLAMTGVDLGSPDIFAALGAGSTAPVATLAPLAELIGKLVPLKVIFAAGGETTDDLAFIQQEKSIFAIDDFNALTIASVKKLSAYRGFASNLLQAGQIDMTPLRDVLTAFSGSAHFSQAQPTELATVLGIELRQLKALMSTLILPSTAPEALTSFSAIVNLAKELGLGGEALKLVLSDDYNDQALAAEAVLGAFRAKFHGEQQFLDRFRPYDDRVRSRKRDGLTDYLLTSAGHRFNTLDDLYNYFLLDVQLGGCMQTSRVVAAISSVQLYVYRCIMDLEQDQRDASDPAHIHVTLAAAAAEEWEWRQNFRVWQANREVFLYPETYILPELRDDKTPLFEDLESTLLQQPIDPQNVRDAFSTYMSGFDQLSKLRIAGSFHDIDKESASDVLHLFGVTPSDPPTFFYRTIENASHGETQSDCAVTYTPWTSVNLQIHCREVSPVVYLGRLFVFWTQITTAPQNVVINSNSIFNGYKHTWRVKYSSLNLDGTWTPPQQLAMADINAFSVGDGVVLDPLLDSLDKGEYLSHGWVPGFDFFQGFSGADSETTGILLALASSSPSSSQSNLINNYKTFSGKTDKIFSSSDGKLADYQAGLIPLYDTHIHTAPVDGYTLNGFQWDRVYPTAAPDSTDLKLTGRNFLVRADKVDFYKQVVQLVNHPKKHHRLSNRHRGQSVLCSKQTSESTETQIFTGVQDVFPLLDRYPWCSIVAKDESIHQLGLTGESIDLFGNWWEVGGPPLTRGLYKAHIATVPGDPNIAMINSSATDSITDAIIDTDNDLLLLQASVRPGEYIMKRLTTTLGENLCRALFVSEVEGLLSLDTQAHLRESPPQLMARLKIQDKVVAGRMDFTGSMGTYFREIFFHVPFLIASQLNSQQNFPAALEWYRYIFDPTANDDELLKGEEKAARHQLREEIQHDDREESDSAQKKIRAELHSSKGRETEKAERRERGEIEKEIEHSEEENRSSGKRNEAEFSASEARDRKEAERDRVWRFIEFRNLDVPSLRKILTDSAAMEAYEQEPFNPHAIARLRLSAYQKCIVMNYIDILIASGDALFTEFQMETVNEATLSYVLALEILGPRPESVGDCGQANENERTYERLAPLIKGGSDFLIEMETYAHSGAGSRSSSKSKYQYMIDYAEASYYLKEAVNSGRRQRGHDGRSNEEASSRNEKDRDAQAEHRHSPKVKAEHGAAHPFHRKGTRGPSRIASHAKAHGKALGRKSPGNVSKGRAPRFAWSVARHMVPAFCVPPNADLLAYWDVVEDRLYKIRHGMDITGALRQLSLFAPPIDPMLLVEATAAGLSLDDVLSSTSGNVPPYRFTYLIEKARQYASQTQSFGGALLSAIEKRDAQQLEVLRVTQQQNILSMTTAMKQSDVDAAQNAVDTLNAQLDTAQFRHDYFQGLIEGGLNTWETLETGARMESAAFHTVTSVMYALRGVTHLVPDLGSPFSLKYGGKELGDSLGGFGRAMEGISALSETIATAAGILGGHERRSDGWQHEVDMATKDITQITTQLVGANIRLKIANKALAIHNKSIAQEQQVADFYTSRFSNVALYTWLATTMQTAYRQAYTSAYAMAKLAEQAYRFERNDDKTVLLSEPYWSQAQSGLLAGEMLLRDLQAMERSFIETNYRTPEITQSFSMMQIAPAALLNLRQNATCTFDIPELCFNLFYPGQYCRKIKAVRLTIPCVAGPLTNVGATLTLTASKLRLKPTTADTDLVPIQLKHSTVIATSTAQNDTGIFEFSFRDERYMPFEGAGAISSWKVELPDGFRQFDYQTITDVIVHISYTAQQDELLRQKVEEKNGAIATVLQGQPLARLFSLRQEFPGVLNRLLHSAANTSVTVSIGPNYLPFFISSNSVQVTRATLLLRTLPSQMAGKFAVTIDGTNVTGFALDPMMANLWSCDISAIFAGGLFGDHAVLIANAGSLAPDAPPPNASAAIDDTRLLDIMLYVEYKLATN